MHVLERFALSSGLKIKSPQIFEHYYPIPIGEYVTFTTETTSESNFYDYWQDVIDLIHPELQKNNIKILQLGKESSRRFKNTLFADNAKIGQEAYIIKNGLLHFGADSYHVHLANSLGKKIASIYSHVLASNRGPFWRDEELQIVIEPEREDDEKPCYGIVEKNDKSINTIKPEVIAKSILNLLGIDFNLVYSTEQTGYEYHEDFVDVVPNEHLEKYGDVNGLPKHMRIRMDLNFDESFMEDYLHQLDLATIITKRPINPNILFNFKGKIDSLIFNYDKSYSGDLSQFIGLLNACDIKHAFISFLPEEECDKFKFKYMDLTFLQRQELRSKKDVKCDLDSLYYKSSKRVLSGGKIYPSDWAWKNHKPTNTTEKVPCPIEDDPELWKDLDYFALVKKIG